MRSEERRAAIPGLLIIVGVLAFGAPSIADPSGITIGDLALKIARLTEVDLPQGGTAQAAATALQGMGIPLGLELSRTVTEADLIAICQAVGAEVSSANLAGPVGDAKGSAFVRSIEASLRAARSRLAALEGGDKEGEVKASCTGRAARAVRRGTPASPASPNATAGPCTGPGEPQP